MNQKNLNEGLLGYGDVDAYFTENIIDEMEVKEKDGRNK